MGNSAEVCHAFITYCVINTGVSNYVSNSAYKNEKYIFVGINNNIRDLKIFGPFEFIFFNAFGLTLSTIEALEVGLLLKSLVRDLGFAK